MDKEGVVMERPYIYYYIIAVLKEKKIPIKFLYHTTINAIYVYTITINNMTFNNGR